MLALKPYVITKSKKSKTSGFTLIELLVSVFIIGLISSGFILSFKESERKTGLMRATEETILEIRKIQNYVLTGERVINLNYKICGYGLRKISDTSFVIYQSHLFESFGDCAIASTSTLYNYTLKDNDFTKIRTTGEFDLFFSTPFVQVFFNSQPVSTTTSSEVLLELCYRLNCDNLKSGIVITSGGSIYKQ